MSTLFIANNRTEQMVGDLAALTPEQRRMAGYTAQRMLWYVGEGDVFVVPHSPSDEFFDYVTNLTGVDPARLTVLTPPPGEFGVDVLSQDRLENPDFLRELEKAGQEQPVDRVFPILFDDVITGLTHAVGAGAGTPGFGFLSQRGSVLLNSKSAFRALAAGTGCALAEGVVVSRAQDAEDHLWELLSNGRCAIVKQDFHVGGFGNDILSPRDGVTPMGAPEVHTITDRAALHEHVTRNWPTYSDQGRYPAVIEHYHPDSVPVYAEVEITDEGVSVFGHGEMLTAPIFNGLVIPAQSASDPRWPHFLDQALALCAAIRGIGYRGLISIDAIVTPGGEILLNEVNGRVGGSTHITYVGRRLVGPDVLRERVLVQRHFWQVPSFSAALEQLRVRGLAFDPSTRTGVVITSDDVTGGTVEYCLIAEDLAAATALEDRLTAIYP